MVLGVRLEMLRQVVDPLAQDGDLDLGRARVRPVGPVLVMIGRLLLLCSASPTDLLDVSFINKRIVTQARFPVNPDDAHVRPRGLLDRGGGLDHHRGRDPGRYNRPALNMLAATAATSPSPLVAVVGRASACSGWRRRLPVEPALVLPLGSRLRRRRLLAEPRRGLPWLCPAASCSPTRRRCCCCDGGASPGRRGRRCAGALGPRRGPVALLAATQYRRQPRVGLGRVPARPVRGLRHRVPRRPARELDHRLSAAGARASPASLSATTSGPTSCARPPCAGPRSIPTTRSRAST